MQHTDFTAMPCPIARSLGRVGEWWSMLILRDAFAGVARFDDFQASLGIAPGMLARRLKALVADGLLEKRRYALRPARYEYVLTPRGEDFRGVLIALMDWGNRHFAPDGVRTRIVDAATGAPVDVALVDRATGRALTAPAFALMRGGTLRPSRLLEGAA